MYVCVIDCVIDCDCLFKLSLKLLLNSIFKIVVVTGSGYYIQSLAPHIIHRIIYIQKFFVCQYMYVSQNILS